MIAVFCDRTINTSFIHSCYTCSEKSKEDPPTLSGHRRSSCSHKVVKQFTLWGKTGQKPHCSVLYSASTQCPASDRLPLTGPAGPMYNLACYTWQLHLNATTRWHWFT